MDFIHYKETKSYSNSYIQGENNMAEIIKIVYAILFLSIVLAAATMDDGVPLLIFFKILSFFSNFNLSYVLLTYYFIYFYNTDYYEPPCKTESDCQPSWNIYFVVKCVDNLCKWIKLNGMPIIRPSPFQ